MTFDPDIKYNIYEQCTKDGSMWKANKDTGPGWVGVDWDEELKGQTL